MKNEMFFMPAIIMVLSLMPALAAAQTSPVSSTLSAAAEEFIRAGAKTVTQGCDLVFRKCADETMQTLEKALVKAMAKPGTGASYNCAHYVSLLYLHRQFLPSP